VKGWSWSTIGECCELTSGGTPSKHVPRFWKGELPFVSARDLKSDRIETAALHIDRDAIDESSAKIAPVGSLLMLVRGMGLANGIQIGEVTSPVAFNQDIRAIHPPKTILPRFLLLALRSGFLNGDGERILSSAAHGTLKIDTDALRSMAIPLPPLAEQRRIVGILDEAFAGIATAKANAEKNLRNARDLVAPTFGKILSSVTSTKLLSFRVEEIADSAKGSIRTGPFGSQLLHGEFVDSGIAVLGIDNAVRNRFAWDQRRYITNEKYSELNRYTVRPGDVIITIMGTCGRCAVIPEDISLAINSKHLCCITLDRSKCLPDYLHAYFLHHPQARQFLSARATGSIMEGLNMGIIKELPVLLPCVFEQKAVICKFAAILSGIEGLESLYQQKLAALDGLKKSLLHQAFSGKI
jgi:type I restriction enzyme S subunit